MRRFKKSVSVALSAAMVVSLVGCAKSETGDVAATVTEENTEAVTEETTQEVAKGQQTSTVIQESSESNASEEAIAELLSTYEQDSESLVFDSSAWNYDAENDVYWQIGVGYCSNPEATDYETMGIYVPGAYMTGVENGDGTYTCTMNTEGEVAGYTAETAPIVFPVNTAGYSAQAAPTAYSYNSISQYLESGFIYVYAGMRGRSNGYDESGNLSYSGGAPWGVTDLKAAVRYYRYNSSVLPGNTDSIFTFGHSGGGAQSSLMGATGDSSLYYEYLTSIGAAMYDTEGNYISDAITGAMAWCPITSLDYANEAYEWNMGQYATEGTRSEDSWTSALSEDLANAYAVYINELGLTAEDGTALTLEETEDGVYTSGTYYQYILSVIEESLNNFLVDTEFPYTQSAGIIKGDGGFGGAGDNAAGGENVPAGGMASGELPSGELPSGDMPTGNLPSGKMPSGDKSAGGKGAGMRGGMGMNNSDSSDSSGTTYETAKDYIDSLNADGEWITYDEATNTASITSIADFVTHCKSASKNVGAFDDLDRGQAENMLFGNDESDALHFDPILASLLIQNEAEYSVYADWDSSYAEAYESDLTSVDKFGNTIEERMNMYNPMYYLSDYYEGYETSNVATYWRIHTGITQGDTALTVEANLALALKQYEGVESVDFATVWGQGHTTAERTGDSTTNFIAWVNECVGQ